MEMAVKEEMVAKGKMLGTKEQMAKEKCKALEVKSAGTQHQPAPKFIRGEVVARRQSTKEEMEK